jgi:hypothetical protein
VGVAEVERDDGLPPAVVDALVQGGGLLVVGEAAGVALLAQQLT